MTIRDRCADCNGELKLKVYKHTEKVGRWTATDGTTMVQQCINCGTPQMTLDKLQRYQLVAAKTVLCANKLEGPVVRYARKTLGLTQKELGLLLDYQHETISKWENEREPIPRAAAVALIGLLCRVIDGEKPEALVAMANGDILLDNASGEIPVLMVGVG